MIQLRHSFREALAAAGRPLVGAHRGASARCRENTLAAFAAAREADFWEMDVRLSADKVPVVIHDATVDRTTAGHGPVGGMTALMLEGYGVPALATVLAAGAGAVFFNIELKPADDACALATAVVETVAALRLERQVLISSFDQAALPAVKRLAPALLTGLLYEERLADPVGRAISLGANALHPRFPWRARG